MSIFCKFDVGPSGRRFRRAVDSDKYNIQQFWKQEHTEKLFGDVEIGHLIELAVLAICLIDKKKDVIGFMALFDYPNIPWVDPAEWEYWIRNMFLKYYLSRNTLFIHFMACVDEVTPFFLEEALLSVFKNDIYLHNIILMVPPNCPSGYVSTYSKKGKYQHVASHCWDMSLQLTSYEDVIARYKHFNHIQFSKFLPRKEIDESDSHQLYMYVAPRKEFCPKLKIRRAVEEDNDEIVDILNKKSPKLKELYGAFYISEMIQCLSETGRELIVAEQSERAVGVMCLNKNFNYKKLQDTYELQPYHGLIKVTPLEKELSKRANSLLATFGEPIMTGQFSPFHELKNIEVPPEYIKNPTDAKAISKRKESKGIAKVKFSISENHGINFSRIFFPPTESDNYSKDSMSLTSSRQSSINAVVPLEGDAFEYEIVNIDQEAIRFITESLSYDLMSTPFFSPKTSVEDEDPLPIPVYKLRRKSSTKPLLKAKVPPDTSVYFVGDSNAFTIELYGLREDIDERQAYDLLEVAFEIMSDKEYCIIQVPCSEKSFSLLQHFCFVPVKSNVCCEYSLYIAHRNAVLGKLRVRRAEFADIPQIAILLNNLQGKETLWTIENSMKTKKHQAYVFQSGINIIGVAIMEPPEQIDFIRIRFNLSPFIIDKYHLKGSSQPGGFATVKSIMVYPVFEQHFRFFAREMMRLSGSTSMLWLTAYRNKWVVHKANSIAFVMAPVLPRKSEIDCKSIPELERFANLSREIMAFSTWFINRKISSIPKMNVDTRIVIVGASRATLGFIEALLFSDASTYLTFTNVTLVSTHGLPYVRQASSPAYNMFSKHRNNNDKYLKSVPYTYYVNVVQGKMVDVNRKQKYITLNNDSRYYYDMLFLLLGKQFQHPDYLKVVFEKENAVKQGNAPSYIRLDNLKHSNTEFQLFNFSIPNNVFFVNDVLGASNAMNYVKALNSYDKSFNVLVYGNTIEPYCCISALLEADVKPENIIFIEPFPPENPNRPRVPVFCNEFVDKLIRRVLKDLKIKVYTSYYFDSWTVNLNDVVTFVNFVSNFQMISLECGVFFYYGKRGVDVHSFVAMNKTGMVYDGGLMIDHKFRTKDPSIFAAGPATVYSRKYYADNKRQKYYDSYEVGQKLGLQIRTQLDPMLLKVEHKKRKVNLDSSSSKQPAKMPLPEQVPVFKKPIVIYCTLPGNLHYLEVRPPGKKIPDHFIQSSTLNGHVLETFHDGYFKLHLTPDLVVDGITCLTKEDYHLDNFMNLYGLSTVVLNNVHFRFMAKQITNFFKFFTMPWALYLYHDQRDELFASVKQLLPEGCREKETLEESFRQIADKISYKTFSSSLKQEIVKKSEKSPYVEAIMDYVIEWLSECDLLLPMYVLPSQKMYYNFNREENGWFKKKKFSVRKLLFSLKQ